MKIPLNKFIKLPERAAYDCLKSGIENIEDKGFNSCLDSLPKEVEISKAKLGSLLNREWLKLDSNNEYNLDDVADAIIKALPELIKGE